MGEFVGDERGDCTDRMRVLFRWSDFSWWPKAAIKAKSYGEKAGIEGYKDG